MKRIERMIEGPAWRSLYDKVKASGRCCLMLSIASETVWVSGSARALIIFEKTLYGQER
jgi:hypothetical protein